MSDRLADLERLARDLVYSLKAHVADDSIRTGVPPETVCPCTTDILARAAALLDDEDPEPTMDDRDPVEVLAGPEPEGEPWDV